jgi:LysR family transcriptional regulator, nod-box dependent transcriptional activator
MRFKGLDLNLLVTLDVLIEERSVSRAAERLHLSQPSVSAALARLRDYFNDPLLESQGRRMIPTPQALQLRPVLAELLANVDRMIVQSRQFNPVTTDRWFHLCISDYLSTVLFPQLMPLLQRQAPHVRLDLHAPSTRALEQFEQGEIDVLLLPHEHCLLDHPADLLFEERFVVAGWSGNVLLREPISMEQYCSAAHVSVSIGAEARGSFADNHLQALGIERQVEILASSFLQVPELLIGTPRLTLMHERLARTLAGRLSLAWQPVPFEFPVMREMIQYHRSRASDASLGWLIARLREAAQD